jgi:hypothetical protein
MTLNRSLWSGRQVLLTGHTGFKRSWLMLCLQLLGAQVCGYALGPEPEPGLFRQLTMGKLILFGGNLIRQPAFVHLRQAQPEAFQVIGELSGSDEMMTDTLFLGSYPVLTTEMIETEIAVIRWFCSQL